MAQWELRPVPRWTTPLLLGCGRGCRDPVLALPLFDIPGPTDGQNVLDVISVHSGQIITFVVTFVVMAVMWNIHNRGHELALRLQRRHLLAGHVLAHRLRFPAVASTMYGAGDHWGSTDLGLFSSDGTGAFYWWTMAYISAIGPSCRLHRPESGVHQARDREYWAQLGTTRARWRGGAFFVVFILAAW